MKKQASSNWYFSIALRVVAIIMALVLIIGVTLLTFYLLEAKQDRDLTAKFLSEMAEFPVDSYELDFGSLVFKQAPSVDRRMLEARLNISFDTTSRVAEAGRLSYLFIWIPKSLTTNNVSSPLGSIGIRFGTSPLINVVPLSKGKVPGSGLMLHQTLPDGSVIYEVQVRIPQSLCPGGGKVGFCSEVTWRSFFIHDGNFVAQSLQSDRLSYMCGPHCNQTDASCAAQVEPATCLVCDKKRQVSANRADIPVSRFFDMGATSGEFSFSNRLTNGQSSKFMIWYEGNKIMDTGCVKVSGVKTAVFGGQSKEIRVDVEPNCAVGSKRGGIWAFAVGCPGPIIGCQATVTTSNGTITVKNGSVVRISGKDAKMPAIVATPNGNCPSPLKWTLTINSPFSNSTGPTKYEKICGLSNIFTTTSGSNWDMLKALKGAIIGGDAVLSWQTPDTGSAPLGLFSFKIRGEQPSAQNVEGLIQSTMKAYPNSDRMWFAPYIARRESCLQQFCINSSMANCSGGEGMPFTSADENYGLFQLRTCPNCTWPTCDQIWSWKENVKGAVVELNKLATEAKAWLNGQRMAAKLTAGKDVPVPNRDVAKCHFKENSKRTIEDAITITTYDDPASLVVSKQRYLSWDALKSQWKFDGSSNKQGVAYVSSVCSGVDTKFNASTCPLTTKNP